MALLSAIALVCYEVPLKPGEVAISMDDLRDRIESGWAGQMVGVAYGYPTRFVFNQQINPDDGMPEWVLDMVANAPDQDDLSLDMTFPKGLDATTQDFGDLLRNATYRLSHTNLGAHRASNRGFPAELPGTPRHNTHAIDFDFQIAADLVGPMTAARLILLTCLFALSETNRLPAHSPTSISRPCKSPS